MALARRVAWGPFSSYNWPPKQVKYGQETQRPDHRARPAAGPAGPALHGDGLYLRKQTRDGASWVLRYSFGGRERWINLLAIKLLLALCVRKSELLGARWVEFDLRGDLRFGPVWHLPSARTKTGEGLDIPLVAQVVEWLQALKVMAADSEYVFPKRRQDRRHRVAHVALDTLNVALLRVAHGLPHFTLHDLRRTARTHLAALGDAGKSPNDAWVTSSRGSREPTIAMTTSGSAGRHFRSGRRSSSRLSWARAR